MGKRNHPSYGNGAVLSEPLLPLPKISFGDAALLLSTLHLNELYDLSFGDTEYSWWEQSQDRQIAGAYQAPNKLTMWFADFDFDSKDCSIGELLFLCTRFKTSARHRNDCQVNDQY